MLATVVVFTSGGGHYVGDNRFEQFWTPGRLLVKHLSLWDSSRGLGMVRDNYWPGPTAVIALIHGLGFPPAIAERLWHALLLTGGAIGTVALLRLWRVQLGFEHLLAGLAYMFNPLTASFLIPSGLFLGYVLTPWFLFVFVRGVRDDRPGRWAAAFALLLFAGEAVNPPVLVFALLPVVPTALYLVLVERSTTWRRVAGWAGRSLALGLAVSAAALVALVYSGQSIVQQVVTTESPKAVNFTSSWSESWRGLGFWLTYWRDGQGLLRPQTASLVNSWPLVFATVAVPCVALATLWRSRWRPRIAFAGIAVLALAVMVAGYPGKDPSPFGAFLFHLYDQSAVAAAFRTTYKAGPGLMLGVSVLFGVGVAAYALRLRPHRPLLCTGALSAAIGLVALSALPMWTGKLYSPRQQVGAIPAYWLRSIDWLNAKSSGARVLVLPGSFYTQYRWGTPGDDIFDALLKPSHIVPGADFFGKGDAAVSAIDFLYQRIVAGDYQPGELGPIARRLGINFVLVRNDLDWQRSGVPRPASLDSLRSDPDLRPVAGFGRPGENVVRAGDRSLGVFRDSQLPPVEVYSVTRASTSAHVDTVGPLLVSGDGEALLPLAANGSLQDRGPVQYTADLGPSGLVQALEQRASVVVSDANRRRVTLPVSAAGPFSETLSAGQNLDRPGGALFEGPGTQSVAVFPDASRISASGTGTALAGFQPWLRPANAFDGDDLTAWEAGGLANPVGAWLRVDLKRPHTLSTMDFVASPIFGQGRHLSKASVHFSDGSSVAVDLGRGKAHVSFSKRRVRWFRIRIDRVSGAGSGPVGFSEIQVPGLRLAEFVRVPDDLFRAASSNPTLDGLIAGSDVTYQFERRQGSESHAEELVVRRAFRSASTRDYEVAGTLALSSRTPDAVVDALLSERVGAHGTSRYGGILDGLNYRGGLATDGRIDTGWSPTGLVGEKLFVHFPAQSVDHVDLVTADDSFHSAVEEIGVTLNGRSVLAAVPPPTDCSTSSLGCVRHVRVPVTPSIASSLEVEVTRVQAKSGGPFGPLPIVLSEVSVGNPPMPSADRSVQPCTDIGLSVDQVPVPVRVSASPSELLAGRQVPVVACGPVRLSAGWHQFEGSTDTTVDQVRLSASGVAASSPNTPANVRVRSSGATGLRATVDAPVGGVLVTGRSFNSGWRATANGIDLGPPGRFDGVTGWRLAKGHSEVVVRFQPQRTYVAAIVVSALAVAYCGWQFLRRRDPA